jgi:RNA-dependent RNA polymerase
LSLQGLLLLHPGKEENGWTHPCVWLRPSQIKITHSDLENPAHRIIDILRGAHMQGSVQISREIIINLSENGVPPNVFEDLFCQSLEGIISPLLVWDGQDAMSRLWAAVSSEGNVMASRMARESAWTARALNIGCYDHDNNEDEDEDDIDDNTSFSHSTAWWGDDLSGCPSSLEETVMAFLDTGFEPGSNTILAEKLHIIAKKAVRTCISKYRVMIPMSCSGLIVPGMSLPLGLSHTNA